MEDELEGGNRGCRRMNCGTNKVQGWPGLGCGVMGNGQAPLHP